MEDPGGEAIPATGTGHVNVPEKLQDCDPSSEEINRQKKAFLAEKWFVFARNRVRTPLVFLIACCTNDTTYATLLIYTTPYIVFLFHSLR